MLYTIESAKWDECHPSISDEATSKIESGHIIYFPTLSFQIKPSETFLLNSAHADPQSKNIGYHPEKHQLWGVRRLSDAERLQLKAFLDRFAKQAKKLVEQTFPSYKESLKMGRTSFRPVQISGRKTSFRKDDKRLHVDAFPSAPNQGKRILRVFCNINPDGQARVWRIGEPFEKVAARFLHCIKKPVKGLASLLRMLRITKSYRTKYDHYMLHLHDLMKVNERYQKEAEQQVFSFPAGSTWIVQTDHVSHAAMQGQFLLEQTFYLPVNAMHDESKAPLRVLEKMLNEVLV